MPNFKSNSRNKVKLGRIIIYTHLYTKISTIFQSHPLFFFSNSSIPQNAFIPNFRSVSLPLFTFLVHTCSAKFMRSRDDYDYLINFIVSFPCKLYTQHIYILISHIFLILELTISIFLSLKKKKKKKETKHVIQTADLI